MPEKTQNQKLRGLIQKISRQNKISLLLSALNRYYIVGFYSAAFYHFFFQFLNSFR